MNQKQPEAEGSDVSPGNTVNFVLPNDARAPGEARRAVRRTFAGWHLPALIDDAVLVVSELVTNAVRHGLPPIGLLLRRRFGKVRMDVEDARPDALEAVERADPLAEAGRGLEIVRSVSDDVGSEHIRGDGKYVFASWDVADPPPDVN